MNIITLDGKVATDEWYPVILVDETDGYTPETGIATSAVTAYYATAGATSFQTYTVDTTDLWREQGTSHYGLLIGAGEFPAEGKHKLLVEAAGCRAFNAIIEIRDRTGAEAIDIIDAILDDTGTAGVQIATGQTIGTVDIAQTLNALATLPVATIADAICDEVIEGAHTAASSLGEYVFITRQKAVGKADWVAGDQRVFAPDDSTVLVTLGHSEAAPTITRAPS